MPLSSMPVFSHELLEESGIMHMNSKVIMEMLHAHASDYMPFLCRKGQDYYFLTMLQGLLSNLERKNIRQITYSFATPNEERNMYYYMREGKWDHEGMLEFNEMELAELLSDEEGMITGDGCDFPKKGKNSAGVASQYSGDREGPATVRQA
jgi:SRSO17 transposase